MSARARRAAASKKVNYAKQQDFSDDDIFEDSDEEPTQRRSSAGGSRSRPRKSKASDPNVPQLLPTMMDDDHEGGGVASRPVFTEKGYDTSLPPLRERFPFLPEYEDDGSPKIELIVGRRLVDEKEGDGAEDLLKQEDGEDEIGNNLESGEARKTRQSRALAGTADKASSPESKDKGKISQTESGPAEYEYLVKYKGRSYLHLEWKSGADLESMNKSAKGIYRRYLKKLSQGTDEDLESPEFDQAYITPERIIDEADQEITIELTDKELLRWEKQREKELAAEMSDDDGSGLEPAMDDTANQNGDQLNANGEERKGNETVSDEWGEEIITDFSTIPIEKLRRILVREGPYYPIIEGSDNPYRDGYLTDAPKKPRASYLMFQCSMRSYFQKLHPEAPLTELMTIIGDAWRALSDSGREAFVQLAKEESDQYEAERVKMEKAQRPNEVWQPYRRCYQVVDRLAQDSFADIFLEPVDLKDFPDYEEFIDTPMDLRTVRENLEKKKYFAVEQFARDMRRIWNNCKVYNQHGSAIWHVADYMSKQFERLYHAWVLEFRERYLRWADPRARPWELSCRKHDGKCATPDDQMVLCDHCDASYGFKCVDPQLKKTPKKAWHCPDCKPKLKSVKGARMLSAVAENAARKRAELGDIPKKKSKQTMYLVKWAGLGYEFCTWETRDDINGDELIANFHRLAKGLADASDMEESVVNIVLENAEHVTEINAGGVSCIPGLRSQLYAQTRALQFIKFGLEIPKPVSSFCGPYATRTTGMLQKHPRQVMECVADLVYRVSCGLRHRVVRSHTALLPPLAGEYDTIIPVTSKGLMMNVGEVNNSVAFLGYRSNPDGSKGPAEIANLIRNNGDIIIAVDGESTIGKSFKEVIGMLRVSGEFKFAYMRFLDSQFKSCEKELVSTGFKGRYAFEKLRNKFTSDRKRVVVHRSQHQLQDDAQPLDLKDEGDDEDDDSAVSEGEFEPDTDDEEMANDVPRLQNLPEIAHGVQQEQSDSHPVKSASIDSPQPLLDTLSLRPASVTANVEDGCIKAQVVALPMETTRSLAFRMLQEDVGYSSDEGGDEENVYFVDGVDDTFTSLQSIEIGSEDTEDTKNAVAATIPARQNEFSAQGNRAKLACAIALSSHPPDSNDFDGFPLNSRKALEVENKLDAVADNLSPTKAKRSTVKIEQVDISTGNVVHIWANVEAAAATLQLSLPQLRKVLSEEYDEDVGDEIGGYKWRYALAGAKPTAGAAASSRNGGSKKAKEAWLEFRDKLYDPAEPHLYKNANRLRDYQVDGVNWLASTWYKRQGAILADEMGLGKTVQIVCYIEHIFRVEKIRRPFLVVIPLSTVEHWRREFQGWTDMVCCVYHDRQRIWRDVLREYEWYFEDRPHTAEFLKFDVLITTYDTLVSDFDIISQIPFRVAVVDEAHRLRNQKGKLLECMREISAKGTMQYGFQSRILMSGTPLQNDLNELWSLLNFIEPSKFPDPDDFIAKFGNMANKEQVESLQMMISPFMLRRVKEDVAKDIPAKEETLIDVELTSIQKQYYRAIFERNHAFLSMGGNRQVAPKLMNIQMELRKVCNHPFLLDGVEHKETERQYKEFLESGSFEGKSPEEQQYMLNQHGYIMNSGKMVLLDKLLPRLKAEGHKILIFSQMVRMLDLLAEYCEFRNYRFERLDGRIRGAERQKSIDRFERDENSFLFLLSTRAGGVGINLTAADICIIFDSDWNPQNDVQAQARCHRIGQTKDVKIYRLITSRSFEQEMFDRASRKLGLEQAVLGTFEQGNDDKPTNEEMEQLLKKGAYALLEDENDEVMQEFCTDDIDSILKKRTRTRVVEGAKTSTWLNKSGMMVSKSKFTTEDGEQLDMDDPQFWQKVMPDFVTPAILLKKLNDLTDELEGTSAKPKGPGRGRWRKKLLPVPEEAAVAADDGSKDAAASNGAEKQTGQDVEKTEMMNLDKENRDEHPDGSLIKELMTNEVLDNLTDFEDDSTTNKVELSKTSIRKIQKFISDLKSMMETIFDEADDEELSMADKDVCQRLLFTVSVKEKIFSEEQRRFARVCLKQLEGDRKRRCRTSDASRATPSADETKRSSGFIPDHLMFKKKERRRRRKRNAAGELVDPDDLVESEQKKPRAANGGAYVGEDGYLHHSDSGEDWSDVGEDPYTSAIKRERITRKEARRRRQWAHDDDAATAAGRPWPVIPRNLVKTVLAAVIDNVLKYDSENGGGIFSVPVPEGEFPDYYEQIKHPMDYGTMKTKLDNGEYRSAQAMQKDFILILQNCRQFNSMTSDIVKEARKQHLLRPTFLKDAAEKNNLFLAEDGSVLEIFDDELKDATKKVSKTLGEAGEGEALNIKRLKKAKNARVGTVDDDSAETIIQRPSKKIKRNAETVGDEVSKPRIKLRISANKDGETMSRTKADGGAKNSKRKRDDEDAKTDQIVIEIASEPKKKKQKKPAGKKESIDDTTAEGEANNALPANDSEVASGDADSLYLDIAQWKSERESLDGSFDSARALFTMYGPWRLPQSIDEDKFAEIAKATLLKMDRHDRYDVFASPVKDEEVPDYSETVTNPMDFGTMRKKVEKGAYGKGDKAIAGLYHDFLLVFENCRLYNTDEGEIIEEAIRIFGFLSEAYVSSCMAVAKKYSH
ncbi:hypothetical protein MPSEU_000095800 [Mayamaea pseudoterrestris]|nr:hypothetical protein MPSEU_000095800 [Mayamaea pseudoterrestris]